MTGNTDSSGSTRSQPAPYRRPLFTRFLQLLLACSKKHAFQDLVFSFVVLQHLTPDQVKSFLAEFYRVLKPGGKAVLQIKLREAGEPRHDPGVGGWLHRRTMLRMVFYTRAEMQQMMIERGFGEYTVTNLRDYAGFGKELDNGQIVIASKPA